MNTTTDYQQQAIDFLQSTGTKFKATYQAHSRYFPNDKETRDIYNITLKNKKNTFHFTFGQSIANTGKEPTEYDVLSSLTKSDPGTFEDFCSDFGYDPDSRKAEATYEAVLDVWKEVSWLFTEDEIEQLQEIN